MHLNFKTRIAIETEVAIVTATKTPEGVDPVDPYVNLKLLPSEVKALKEALDMVGEGSVHTAKRITAEGGNPDPAFDLAFSMAHLLAAIRKAEDETKARLDAGIAQYRERYPQQAA